MNLLTFNYSITLTNPLNLISLDDAPIMILNVPDSMIFFRLISIIDNSSGVILKVTSFVSPICKKMRLIHCYFGALTFVRGNGVGQQFCFFGELGIQGHG